MVRPLESTDGTALVSCVSSSLYIRMTRSPLPTVKSMLWVYTVPVTVKMHPTDVKPDTLDERQ